MSFLAIDPGLDGGLAMFFESFIQLHLMPTREILKWKTVKGKTKQVKSHDLDDVKLAKIVQLWEPDIAIVELVHAMPGNGATSMFTFGRGTGKILGVLSGLGIPYIEVPPQTWKKVVMKGQIKDSEIIVAENMFPDLNFKRTERCTQLHDGLVDAVLIGEWYRRSKGDLTYKEP